MFWLKVEEVMGARGKGRGKSGAKATKTANI